MSSASIFYLIGCAIAFLFCIIEYNKLSELEKETAELGIAPFLILFSWCTVFLLGFRYLETFFIKK